MTPIARRNLAVMALLDINLGQWLEWLDANLDAEEKLGEQVGDLVAQLINALQHVEEPGQPQLYLQAIAMLDDESLFKVIEMVTGKRLGEVSDDDTEVQRWRDAQMEAHRDGRDCGWRPCKTCEG